MIRGVGLYISPFFDSREETIFCGEQQLTKINRVSFASALFLLFACHSAVSPRLSHSQGVRKTCGILRACERP